ncbi:MFS transporter [Devosia nitrariae]|uniref:MFS transporter n=1 Tax=Devosia nitrariae TaxID=2071872 RepID=A0ABQ5W2T2_9HYPH|nr:MFS transporter [Devosia nitrariae]GLQ54392.1 MFS transporter [Devosia nitrariae]
MAPSASQRLVMLVFFLQPLAFGSWLPRIPDVQEALGLGPAGLAGALIGLPVGTLLTLPFAGPLVGRIGARHAIVFGFFYYALAVSLPAFTGDAVWLFISLMLTGSAISFLELGLNVKADRVEKATGKLLMNTAHGCWSLGIMAGSLIGAGIALAGLEARWAVLLMALVTLPLGVAAGLALPRYPAEARPEGAVGERSVKRSSWSLPGWPLLGICLFVFGITMTEGAMADWSAVFLRDVFNAQGLAGIGYTVFALMVAAGRFGGDGLKARFGAVALARTASALALAGIAVLFLSPSMPVALIGFAIAGLGASVGFPLAVTAAASLADRPASANVAVLSFVALVGFLVGPPLIGFVAEYVDMRAGLAALVPVLIVSFALAGRLAQSSALPSPQESPA